MSDLSNEQVSGNFHIMCTGVGPELMYIPPDNQVYPTSLVHAHNTLWQIAQAVAERDSTYEWAGVYFCNYCEGSQKRWASSLLDEELVKQFPHTPDCIVTKARALMEWRKQQPCIEVKR